MMDKLSESEEICTYQSGLPADVYGSFSLSVVGNAAFNYKFSFVPKDSSTILIYDITPNREVEDIRGLLIDTGFRNYNTWNKGRTITADRTIAAGSIYEMICIYLDMEGLHIQRIEWEISIKRDFM